MNERRRFWCFTITAEGRLPKLSQEQIDDIKKKFDEVLRDYPDVKFNGTYVDEEGMGICDWEAPNAEVVKEVVNKVIGSPPHDPVIVVKRAL